MTQPQRLLTAVIMGLFCFSLPVLAQEEEVAVVDVFQENFFDALTQKGIGNYDKAIVFLEKCLEAEPNNAVVYYEMARANFLQKKYIEAQQAYQKSLTLNPNYKWTLVGLYDVYYEMKDYNQALPIVTQLVTLDKKYREDLVSLYMFTKQYDKALSLIKILDEEIGSTTERDSYKKQIFSDAKYSESEKEFLLAQIKKYPKIESNYISLIYLYSESNQEEMAFEIAKNLEKQLPNSEWAQVGLFKFYLSNNKTDDAVLSMHKVLKNNTISNRIKHKILNEFLIYSNNNNTNDNEIETALQLITDESDLGKVAKQIGKFYQKKNKDDKAIYYFKISLANTTNDLDTHLLLLQSYLKKEDFKTIATETENLIEIFPLQPDLFYLAGLANNKLTHYKKAKDFLETGLDFLVDNAGLEINFYAQLIESCNGLGDIKGREIYIHKSKQLINQKK